MKYTNIKEFQKGEQIAEGKTKILYGVVDRPELTIFQAKDDITKLDDASLTQKMVSKSKYATATACMVFELLQKAGIPTAYVGQYSENEMVVQKCTMISLEVIARRYAVGSYLNRYPNLKKEEGSVPHRFHQLMFELFLKTTGGSVRDANGNLLIAMPNDVLKPGKNIEDPFIESPYPDEFEFKIMHSKLPGWHENADLGINIPKGRILGNFSVAQIEKITHQTFLVLEAAWGQLGCRLIDFKIEFGITTDGELVVADVIDNDSWRLRTADWKELSKQLFRDDADMEEVSEKYALVAKLVEKFSLPKQAMVFWRGSDKDALPTIPPAIPGVTVVDIIESAHKAPSKCLLRLEEVLTQYPEGGVIIPIVGMSNGLGPILSARTSWPVIGVCASGKEHTEDVWSNFRLPSLVPMMSMLSPENAVLAAINILAQKNPVAYMKRQYEIEKLDI